MGVTLGSRRKSRNPVRRAIGRHRSEPSIRRRKCRRHEVVVGKITGVVIAHRALARGVLEALKLGESLGCMNETIHKRRTAWIPAIVIAMTFKPCRAEILNAETVQLKRDNHRAIIGRIGGIRGHAVHIRRQSLRLTVDI